MTIQNGTYIKLNRVQGFGSIPAGSSLQTHNPNKKEAFASLDLSTRIAHSALTKLSLNSPGVCRNTG
jgi:hypothetical protein